MRLDNRNVMRSVNLNKPELLDIVKSNKEKHIQQYNESVNDYKLAAIKIMTDNLELVNSGDLDKIASAKSLPSKPISYENSYARAIRMLELSVDETITLEEDVFNQLVLDEWSWKGSFSTNLMAYKLLNGSL